MKFYKPNIDIIRNAAKKVKDGGDFKKTAWHKLKAGDNFLRILPPFNENGEIFVEVNKWWVNGIPDVDNMSMVPHLERTWPEKGVEDYIEKAYKYLSRNYPELAEELDNKWPNRTIYVNVIDRDDEDAGPKILRLPVSVYNWIIEETEKLYDVELNPYDPDDGFDIKVERKVTGPRPKDVKYITTFLGTQTKDGFIPLKSKLHEDEDIVEEWGNNICDLNKILLSFPNDEKLAGYQAQADLIIRHYEKQVLKQKGKPPVNPDQKLENDDIPEDFGADKTKEEKEEKVEDKPKCFGNFGNPCSGLDCDLCDLELRGCKD